MTVLDPLRQHYKLVDLSIQFQMLLHLIKHVLNYKMNYYIVDKNRLLEQTNGINTVVGDVISLINDANGLVANAIAANQVVMTTGQLAGVQDTTTLQAAFKTASDNLDEALKIVDPFYLDFKTKIYRHARII